MNDEGVLNLVCHLVLLSVKDYRRAKRAGDGQKMAAIDKMTRNNSLIKSAGLLDIWEDFIKQENTRGLYTNERATTASAETNDSQRKAKT